MKGEFKVQNKINALSRTVLDFLKDERFISIPRYQREYSWEKSNIETFLSDIHDDYYLGNIILYKEKKFTEIIDGQQRLITTFLILISLKNLSDNIELKEKIDKLIYFNGKCKLQLKDRIGSDGRNILNYLLDNDKDIPNNVKKYNEIKNYLLIKNKIKELDIEKLFSKLTNSIIVEIGFSKNITEAYEMFVNLNTKGKPLSEIEILKSKLFKYLLSQKNSDMYKEKWQEMLNNIPDKEYATFVSDTYLFYVFQTKDKDNLKTSGTVKHNFSSLLEEINNKQKAAQIFYLMTDTSLENIYSPYKAVKNYDLKILGTEYYSNLNTSLSAIDSLWKLFGEYGFVQSDILFVSLFRDKQAFLTNNINYVYTFMEYLFIYEISRSIIGTSPAHYSNIFKQLAKEIYDEKDPSKIKIKLKKFSSQLIIDTNELKKRISEPDRFIKNYKTAKFIILLAENNLNSNLTVEHFIHKKTTDEINKKYVGSLGNLIPVIKDKYKDKEIEKKLEMYKKDSIGDKAIMNFLDYGFDSKNYIEKITKRTRAIADKFAKLAEKCYNELIKK